MKITIRQPLAFSEIGKKDNQEDFLYPDPTTVTTTQRVFILCDGMGGHEHGEVASQTVATTMGHFFEEHADEPVTEDLFNRALSVAYDALDAKDNPDSVKKMGTTMTCLYLHDGHALVAHIGDSRVYQIRPSLYNVKTGELGIVYQSSDHSLVNQLLKLGELTPEEARNYPHKNIITRAMQPNQEVRAKADVFDLLDVKDDDYFFLCCDGVLEQLTNEKLCEILASNNSDSAKMAEIQALCDGNTRDNYSCWIVPLAKASTQQPLIQWILKFFHNIL